jgi:hypothetical protein
MILHQLLATFVLLGQAGEPATIEVAPSSLELEAGETAKLEAVVKDGEGNPVPGAVVIFFSTGRTSVTVTPDGRVEAHEPGEISVVALSPSGTAASDPELMRSNDPGIRVTIPVKVKPSPLARLEFKELPAKLYAGSTVPVGFLGVDARGRERDARADVQSSDATIVSVAPFGAPFAGSADAHPNYHRTRPDIYPDDAAAVLTAARPGTVTLTATTAEGVRAERSLTVEESPVRSLSLVPSSGKARTGDVVHFEASALDGSGRVVSDAPVRYLLEAWSDPSRPDTVGAGAPAQVARDGRFVAEQPGAYTVLAISGSATAQASVVIEPRNVKRQIELVGHAPVRDRISSDLWVWEGVDGRDYAVHGTWNSDGRAYFYDVTDPSKMERIDEVQVDARTVNDVKVSADGRICVISREGASNRRNGLVILDVTNPRDVTILAQYDDGMTGGVHNVFIHENHVYAVNNGRRWDVINVEDPRRPARAARFETTTPGRSVHDVWVRDGIAYQAGNTDAIILVDVGGGGMGGSPARPVEMGRMPQLTGWNHSVWPFRSKSAGKFYVVGGDEAHPYNPRVPDEIISWKERIPSRAMGWVHFIEFDDLSAPKEIARYQIPEAGPHNYWIDWEREVMYVAYFNAGLRVVDVSGELMGDLYRQGREIAKFYSDDSEGYVPNAPFVWGPQPHKGTIFFSDFHSGLWAVRLVPPLEEEKKTEVVR